MLANLAIADSDPNGNGDEIVGIAILGLLVGGAIIFLGAQQSGALHPPGGTNCPTCGVGQVCDERLKQCVVSSDGGGGTGCPTCGAGICCPPFSCSGGRCLDPQGGGLGTGCTLPCAQNGLACNPHTHQCQQNAVARWQVSWPSNLPGIVFMEGVDPVNLDTFDIRALIQFNYTGPGGSATVGYSIVSDGIVPGLCKYAFTSQENTWLEPATDLDTGIETVGVLWPDNCFLCSVPFLPLTFTVYPYVVLPDGPHYGPAFLGLMSC